MPTTEAPPSSSSPAVKLNEVAPPRVTIGCKDCGSHTRVYHVPPVTQVGRYRFCPQCGSGKTRVGMDSDLDYWESLARDYGYTVELMKQLFKLWVPTKHYRFSDFVAELRSEIADGTLSSEPEPDQPKPTSIVPRLVVPGRAS